MRKPDLTKVDTNFSLTLVDKRIGLGKPELTKVNSNFSNMISNSSGKLANAQLNMVV